MTKPKELKDDLGGREKRRELLRQLNGSRAGKRIPGYTDYVKRMTELDAFMEECSAKNAYGASKPLNAAAREKLLKSIRETAAAGEVYLQNALEAKGAGEIADLRKGAPGLVNQLQGMLARDQEAMERYDPKAGMNLIQVLENSRSTVVHLDGENIEGLGGAQNSRLPITFRDRSGKVRRGVFTRQATVEADMDKYVNDLLEQAASNCGDATKNTIRNLIGTYRQKHASAAKVEEMQDLDEAYRLLAEFHKKHGMDTPEKLREKNLLKAGIDPHRHAPAPEEPGQEGPEEPGLGPA